MDAVDKIVAEVLRRLADGKNGGSLAEEACSPAPEANEQAGIPVEMSARHVHLTAADMKALFGTEELPVSRMISQPGQYLSTLRVRLTGPKGSIENVAVLGPVRGATQVEISATDARALGLKAPVRLSGNLDGAAAVYIQAGESMLRREAAIVAKRHIHMLPSDAERYGVKDGQSVCVRVSGSRPIILEDVLVRVTDKSALALHIDTDEANACGAGKNCLGGIVDVAGLCATGQNASRPAGTASSDSRPDGPRSSRPAAPTADEPCSARAFEGRLLTEEGVRGLCRENARELLIKKSTLVTPLARDTAKEMGLRLVVEESK